MISPELRARVSAWIADDPDQRDAGELRELLGRAESGAAGTGEQDAGEPGAGAMTAQAAAAELADRFAGRLRFGTAGLRGAVGAGPNRMNRAVVRATTAALAAWLPARGRERPWRGRARPWRRPARPMREWSSAGTRGTDRRTSPRRLPVCWPAPGSGCACRRARALPRGWRSRCATWARRPAS